MLAQIVTAYIHQLHRIQGTSAHIGGRCRVACLAVEAVVHLDIGHGGSGNNTGVLSRVPGKGAIETGKYALACHAGLSAATLFRRATKHGHCAGFSGFGEILFHQNTRMGTAGTQQIMSAAVSVAAGGNGLLFSHTCLLGKTAQRIELRQQSDVGTTAAIGCGEGGRDIGNAGHNRKALRSKILLQIRSAFHLGKGRFCRIPNLIG